MNLLQACAAIIKGIGGDVAGMTLGRFHELIWDQPEVIERIWLNLEIMHGCVEKDRESDCLYPDFPRKQYPFSVWEMPQFFEVTLLRQK